MKTLLSTALLLLAITSQAQTQQTLKPTETEALINVIVTNEKHNPRKGDVIIFENEKSKVSYTGTSDASGKFSILLPKGITYLIKYKNFGDKIEYNKMTLPAGKELMTSKLTIQIETPKTYTLQDVFFDTGKATLKPESNKALNELVEVMKLKNTLEIEIAGHTDNVGSVESNMKLSQDRANSVKNYLVKNGIAATRVVAKGYGDTQPVDDNSTEEGRRKNRRTEVRIVKE